MTKLKYFARRYFIDALNAMAIGFFATLIIGVILNEIVKIPFLDFLTPVATFCKKNEVVGAAIGLSIAYAFKSKLLVICATAVVGAMGYTIGRYTGVTTVVGGPVGAYVASIVAAEIGLRITGKTKIDILLTPLVTVICGGIIAIFLSPWVGDFMIAVGSAVNEATVLAPIPMGIVLSVVMGIILTAPISSAAICISLGLSGLAAGAATIGCAAQMVGFAVMSYKANGIGGVVSVGIGTSMLQFPNIVKKPVIWLPTIIASAIIGPFATTIFQMTNVKEGAGMGTSGLVGQIGTISSMIGSESIATILLKIGLLHFALPILIVVVLNYFFIKKGLYSNKDLQLNSNL